MTWRREPLRLNQVATREKSCDGKIQHESFPAAFVACRKSEEKFGGRFFAYHCRFCNYFHIGHHSAAVAAALRDRRAERLRPRHVPAWLREREAERAEEARA